MAQKDKQIRSIDPLIQALIDARKVMGYTQAQVAMLAGVSLRTLVEMESGANCTLKTLRQVAEIMRVRYSVELPKHRLPTLYEVWRENEEIERAQRGGYVANIR